jgi:hypothetical protein
VDNSTSLNQQAYRGTLLALYDYFGETRDADNVNPIQGQEASGNRDSFNSLIYCARSDGSYLSTPLFTKYARDRSSNRRSTTRPCHLDDFHIGAPRHL